MTETEVKNLMNTGRYPGSSNTPSKLVETHISWVILTDDFAFKIKKPLQLSFLDFSELEDRKYFCEREVELNKRLTNDLYLAVLPIYKNNDQFQIGGENGQVVDYTVQMRKLDRQKEMPVVLKKHAVSKKFIHSLAEKVADFHQKAEVIQGHFDDQALQQTFNDIQSVTDTVHQLLGTSYVKKLNDVVRASNVFIQNHKADFQQRYNREMIRDCHGDLHSGNIFVYPDPVIFDCIEFNDQFRQIDVLNEIAFFCMDLEMYGEEELSSYFLHQYQSQFPALQTDADERLFGYYKCYRANVRAKVNALKAPQAHTDDQLTDIKQEVKMYINRMKNYLPEFSTVE